MQIEHHWDPARLDVSHRAWAESPQHGEMHDVGPPVIKHPVQGGHSSSLVDWQPKRVNSTHGKAKQRSAGAAARSVRLNPVDQRVAPRSGHRGCVTMLQELGGQPRDNALDTVRADLTQTVGYDQDPHVSSVTESVLQHLIQLGRELTATPGGNDTKHRQLL